MHSKKKRSQGTMGRLVLIIIAIILGLILLMALLRLKKVFI
ncbi:MAG: hypothetical protein N3D84_01225 [Candidatus Woesearchaeota archaeon]|nr:hypothetical protein [Candidatus Woesearchaeota archaeon]